ncbi:MAG: homoserine dehydrogenase [Chloroflexi bacterium]|nr:homoserine dehydrogenase [Chloroflexota bacterium]
MTRAVGVGLLGLGTVGSAVARAMGERGEGLSASAGRDLRLVRAAVRDASKTRDLPVEVTANAFDVLDDPDVDVVVEVIGGHRPAIDLHLAAFERGKHVVTANKEVVAKEWRALHEAARGAKRELRFEAAVAAAVPVVAAARALGAARVRTIRGLLNGTTTYICSRMEAGASFDDALREAQAAGYAEADPSADVDGWDPAYKLSILISLAEGRWHDPAAVSRTSLRGVTTAAMNDAAGRGMRIRYIATAEFGQKGTTARVAPEEVEAASLEGQATGPTNVVRFDTDLAGVLTFMGPGAGGDATASAILGDVIQIARGMR